MLKDLNLLTKTSPTTGEATTDFLRMFGISFPDGFRNLFDGVHVVFGASYFALGNWLQLFRVFHRPHT